jgi:MFS family permease
VGLVFISIFSQKIGRKRSIQFGGVVGMVGAILQAASPRISVFFVGRVVAGISAGIMLTTVNVYQSEIAPPDSRGAMVAFQLLALTTAGGFASWVGYACNFSSNLQFSWCVFKETTYLPLPLTMNTQAFPTGTSIFASTRIDHRMLFYTIFTPVV